MMAVPKDPVPQYHPFPEHDWVPPEPPRRRRWPWIAGAGAVVVVIGAVAVAANRSAGTVVGADDMTPKTVSTNPMSTRVSSGPGTVSSTPAPVSSSSATVLAPQADVTPAAVDPGDVAQRYATKIAQGEPDSATLAVLGTMAYLYADGVAQLFAGDPSLYKAAATPVSGGGWDIGGGTVLSDFGVTPEGLVQTFSRNGISVDKLVAPGDGTVYTATPTTGDQRWSGQLTAKVHSFRFLDGELQILVTNENQTTAQGGLSFSTYRVAGEQYQGSCCEVALPGVTRTGVWKFPNVPGGGGMAAAGLTVDQSGASDNIEVDVPALG